MDGILLDLLGDNETTAADIETTEAVAESDGSEMAAAADDGQEE